MNEFEGWHKVLEEWKEVNRMKKLNQELYDQLGGSILYIFEYAKKNKIDLPNKKEIERMCNRIHNMIDVIESDESLQGDKSDRSDDNLTDPLIEISSLFLKVI
jgi:hypothetical protein